MVKKILATSLYAKHHHDISDHLPKYHAMSVALMVTNLMMMYLAGAFLEIVGEIKKYNI